MANLFPRWTNLLPLKLLCCGSLLAVVLVGGIWYYFTPKYTRVGYMPTQPVPFDHALHVEQLGMDCRYCHSFVEVSGHSNVPSTQTCMSCHSQVARNSLKLEPVRKSWETGEPLEWVKVHRAPDYVFFNHAVHVNRGVSCQSCHGNVNEMEVVWHAEPQSMAWCLDCHRAPENHLRPLDEIYNFAYQPPEGQTQQEIGLKLKEEWKVQPGVNCASCHR